LLQNWTPSDERLISIKVQGASEQDAAEMMLRAAYSGSCPAEATPEQLLACMVLADRCVRWGGACADLIAGRL